VSLGKAQLDRDHSASNSHNEYMPNAPRGCEITESHCLETGPDNRSGMWVRRIGQAVVVTAVLLLGPIALVTTSASASTSTPATATSAVRMAVLSQSVFNRVNAIRASFGLAAGQATSAYNSEVLQAVRSNEDPPFAPVTGGVVGEESLWGVIPGATAASVPSPLVVVNGWVYHDGWGGSVQATWNADCTSATAPGCNGHRRSILSKPPVPGAKLSIDVTTRVVNFNGSPALAVAALLVWKMPAQA